MNLPNQLLTQIADPTLTHNERAWLRCQLSKTLAESGNYEGAREAMGELWQRVGERPNLEGLDRATAAEVLLRGGALTTYIGCANQIEGAQETAKNLISESITIIEALGDTKKLAEAQFYLANCYWRQGEYDEARITLREARSRLTDEETELKVSVLLLSAIVEKVAGRLNDALRIHTEAAPLFEVSDNHALRGKYHNSFANVLENLGIAEHRDDYIDRALVEYTAASYYLEQAGHERFRARVENNLGFLYSTIGKFAEAHEHVGRARKIFARLRDSGSMAQADDTRARVLLAEGKNHEAEKVARAAVQTLEKGDEKSLLAEALTTHGTALARTGRHVRARLTLRRAIVIAEQVGDREGAGQAALAVIEELSEHIAPGELQATYGHAAELLARSQHPGLAARLVTCSRRVMDVLAAPRTAAAVSGQAEEFKAPSTWKGFSLKEALRRYERFLIELALREAGGVVTCASQLLGFKHYQSLISLINHRYQNLLPDRSPVKPRRRSIILIHESRTPQGAVDDATNTVTILHAEDDKLVAVALKEVLEAEGWEVETCADGPTALKMISGSTPYDLLLLDNELPGLTGIELVRRAWKLPHRRRTPIVLLSAGDCEKEAWRAGADAFLRKPEDISKIADTIARLLAGVSEEHH